MADDAKRKIDAIESYAKVFTSRNMTKSVECIKELEEMLLSSVDRSALENKFVEFLQHVWNEFIGNSSHRDNCIKLVDRIITNAIKSDPIKFHNAATDSIPSMEERTRARKMLAKLISILKKSASIDEEERMIAMNMLYLAMVEGPFEEDVKACYVWAKLSAKEDINYQDVSSMSIKDIYDYFNSKLGDTSLFEGWNRNLRNAIAHFSYIYDSNARKMMYTDKPANWTKTYTLNELGELYEKLDDVDELIMIELLVLSIRDLCFATTPPWRAKNDL